MFTDAEAKTRLRALLRERSVFHGDFLLASGARSSYYLDCRLTTLDAEGAWLVGQVMRALIRQEAERQHLAIDSIGGLTLGADPIALAVGMYSFFVHDAPCLRTFVVRKAAKDHGQAKLIEGNFRRGDRVAVVEDVITRGDSTLSAIHAVQREGGQVAFVAVLVDRQQGGRERIQELGHRVVPVFQRDDLLHPTAEPPSPAGAGRT
ncbi:MAG: orotate phosphoribosyltransferase [Verrucomicrobia bacterium]|nr:orotate phosphoribosyltransferase [Verrucomicrobiota bacterium]